MPLISAQYPTFHDAVEARNLEAVSHWISKDSSLMGLRNACGHNALDHAALVNDPQLAALLLERGADVSTTCSEFGMAALHIAAINDGIEVLDLLIQAQSDVHASLYSGETPLLAAAQTGSVKTLSRLMTFQINLEHVNDEGNTALHLAAAGGHCDCIKLLLDSGAPMNALNQHGQTPLDLAVQQGQDEVVAQLQEIILQKVAPLAQSSSEPVKRL